MRAARGNIGGPAATRHASSLEKHETEGLYNGSQLSKILEISTSKHYYPTHEYRN